MQLKSVGWVIERTVEIMSYPCKARLIDTAAKSYRLQAGHGTQVSVSGKGEG